MDSLGPRPLEEAAAEEARRLGSSIYSSTYPGHVLAGPAPRHARGGNPPPTAYAPSVSYPPPGAYSEGYYDAPYGEAAPYGRPAYSRRGGAAARPVFGRSPPRREDFPQARAPAAIATSELARRIMTAAADPRPSTVRAAARGTVGVRLPSSADLPVVVGAHLAAPPPLPLHDWDRELKEALTLGGGAVVGAGAAAPRAGAPVGTATDPRVAASPPPSLPPNWSSAAPPSWPVVGGGGGGGSSSAAGSGLPAGTYGGPAAAYPAQAASAWQMPPDPGAGGGTGGRHAPGGPAAGTPAGTPAIIHLHPGSTLYVSGPASVGAARTSKGLLLAPGQQTRVSAAAPNYIGQRLVIPLPRAMPPPGARSVSAVYGIRDPVLAAGNTADEVLHLFEELLDDPGRFSRLRKKAIAPLVSADAFYRSASYDSVIEEVSLQF